MMDPTLERWARVQLTPTPRSPRLIPHVVAGSPIALRTLEVVMRRLLDAVCELIEAHAARVRTETFEAEMENADWALMSGDEDD